MIKFQYNEKEYFAKYYISSKYSDFWITENMIVKIRKDYCDIFGDTSFDEAAYQTNNEYSRGLRFEPSIYLDVVRCFYSDGRIRIGLLMRFIDNIYRLDLHISDIRKEHWKAFVDKLQALIDSAPIIEKFEYTKNLIIGNKRLSDNLDGISNSTWLLSAWDNISKCTKALNSVLDKRVVEGRIKDLHGDLSFTNVYFFNGKFFFLDPCVVSKDMYYLDSLYQYADFMSELIRYDKWPAFNIMLCQIEEKDFFDIKLFKYYMLRHSLIRATVHFLANENDYLDYKDVWDKLYEQSGLFD